MKSDWRRALALALRLGITPEAFWRLSLVEWQALTQDQAEPLRRMALSDLMTRFPDEDDERN